MPHSNNTPAKEKIVAIVQARLGSSRLPGKVLLDVCGKPLLWHVMRRVMAAKLVDETILATADNEQNAPIVDFAKKYGFTCYAGSEIDLLDRFYQPCKAHGATIVVRITADCPLVDPAIIDKTIRYFLDSNGQIDYLYNNSAHTLPDGLDVEVFTMKTLETLWSTVAGEFEREWFTTVMRDNPKLWRHGAMTHDIHCRDTRWTVDYPEDIALIRRIFEALDNEKTVFSMYDILDFLKAHPEVNALNDAYKERTDAMAIAEAKAQAAGNRK